MLQRVAHLLLVAALASSGASAPFLHVHAHGRDHGAAASDGRRIDAHCAHHHAAGAHWHLNGGPAADAGGVLALAGDRHRHAAVALSAVAVETSPTWVAPAGALTCLPGAGLPPDPCGVHTPVDATTGPDPPPLSGDAARGPPVGS